MDLSDATTSLNVFLALVGVVTLAAVITSIRPVRAYIGEDTANLVNVSLATIAALGTATLVIIEFRNTLGGLAGITLLALGIIVATILFVLAWRACTRGGKFALAICAAIGTTALVAIAQAWAWGFVWALWAIILFALLPTALTRHRPERETGTGGGVALLVGIVVLGVLCAVGLEASGVSAPWRFAILAELTVYLAWLGTWHAGHGAGVATGASAAEAASEGDGIRQG
ncbi:hypothetical protein ABXJ56_09440 [Microbacterium chocolatum]|uniref:hypothetical protein n=1 Tax=Microbacterium aurantiacum TaxID=162393 RepID=UPI0033902573